MRENLGWQYTCPEERCAQDWLTFAATEMPQQIDCARCGQTIEASLDPASFSAASTRGQRAALNVVPCGNAGPPPTISPEFQGAQPSAAPPPQRSPAPPTEIPQDWYCLLSNGEEVKLDREHMVLGRSKACDVVVPSAKVSRQHANIHLAHGQLTIEDLGSANGLWHNGERVTRQLIKSGDAFILSDAEIQFVQRPSSF